MKLPEDIAIEFGLPRQAFRVFEMVDAVHFTTSGLIGLVPHYDSEYDSSPFTKENENEYHEVIRVLLELNLLRIVTEQDQEEIRAEICRQDIYTTHHSIFADVPRTGIVQFTRKGAALWIEMQHALGGDAESLPDYGWAFRELSLLSKTRGLMLHLVLSSKKEEIDLVCAYIVSDLESMGGIDYVDISHGVAPKPWRMNWWSLPAPCHYRLVQILIDRQKWWPKRERSTSSQYRDIDHFRWFMQLDWELPPLLSGKMSGEKAP